MCDIKFDYKEPLKFHCSINFKNINLSGLDFTITKDTIKNFKQFTDHLYENKYTSARFEFGLPFIKDYKIVSDSSEQDNKLIFNEKYSFKLTRENIEKLKERLIKINKSIGHCIVQDFCREGSFEEDSRRNRDKINNFIDNNIEKNISGKIENQGYELYYNSEDFHIYLNS